MKTEKIKSLRAAFVAALVALAVNACVKNDDAAAAVTAPSNLGYGVKTLTFAKDVAVSKSASVTGSLTSCSVSPALPTGLGLDGTNCTISGTPTATQAATSYTVTGSNSVGTTTASVKIAVVLYTATMQGTPTHTVGKSTFQIKVTDSAGAGVAGLTPKIVPEMDMGSMQHTTPVDTVTDNGGGLYTAVVYYLMSSDGGYWYVKTLNSGGMTEIATRISMTVGGSPTARVSVSHTSDKYTMGMMASNRPYFVFIEDIIKVAPGNYTVKVFAAVRKSMMEHPAFDNAVPLTNEIGTPWSIGSAGLELQFCTAKDTNGNCTSGPYTYSSPTNNGSGHFTFTSIAELTAVTSQELKFTVKLAEGITGMALTRGPGSLSAAIP